MSTDVMPWPLEARDVGDAIVDLLAAGWRVSLKTHLVPRPWVTDEYAYRDEDGDGIGFVATGYSYGAKRDEMNAHPTRHSGDDAWRSSGVAPTPEAALTNLLLHLGRIDPGIAAVARRAR